jgi:hypothetical protein
MVALDEGSGVIEGVSVAVMVADRDGSADGDNVRENVGLRDSVAVVLELKSSVVVWVGSKLVVLVRRRVVDFDLLSDCVSVTVDENNSGSDITTPPGRQCPPYVGRAALAVVHVHSQLRPTVAAETVLGKKQSTPLMQLLRHAYEVTLGAITKRAAATAVAAPLRMLHRSVMGPIVAETLLPSPRV